MVLTLAVSFGHRHDHARTGGNRDVKHSCDLRSTSERIGKVVVLMGVRRIWLAVMVCLLVALPSQAYALNFGAYYADDRAHSVKYEDLLQLIKDGIYDSRTINYDPTVLNTSYESNHDLADVANYDGNYTAETWYGITSCVTTLPASKCDHWHIQYNLKYIDTANEAFHTACHELGHSVGLKHRPPGETANLGCMDQPSDNYLGTHNYNHINGWY